MVKRDLLSWVSLAVGTIVVLQGVARWWTVSSFGSPEETPPSTDWGWILTSSPVPVVLLLVALVLSWRWPLVGTVAFLGYFVLYVAIMFVQVFPYVGAVAFGSLFAAPQGLAGALFLSDWLSTRYRRASA